MEPEKSRKKAQEKMVLERNDEMARNKGKSSRDTSRKDVDQPWKIVMQNVRGLITAGSRETLKLIENYTNNDKIILMNFTETWLDKTIREEADLEGFNTYRCDRTSEIARGGVAIYLYDKLEIGQKWEKRNNKCEMVGIEIK